MLNNIDMRIDIIISKASIYARDVASIKTSFHSTFKKLATSLESWIVDSINLVLV